MQLGFYSIGNVEIRYFWWFSLLKMIKESTVGKDEHISDEEEHEN